MKFSLLKNIVLGFFFLFSFSYFAYADGDFVLGKVERVLQEEKVKDPVDNRDEINQTVSVQKYKSTEKPLVVSNFGVRDTKDIHYLTEGKFVLLAKNPSDGSWYVADIFRLPSVALLFAIFFGVVVYFTGFLGVRSLFGLLLSLCVLGGFIAPQILNGANPFLISLIGGAGISFFSLFLSHGFNIRTGLAFVSILGTLFIALVITPLFVHLSFLSGMGTEDAFTLLIGSSKDIQLQGVLMGGIIIGTLGILDDITTTQVTAVAEIKKANPESNAKTLYQGGLAIGKEHILALINTLALAYFGAALPLLLLMYLGQQPLWVAINSETLSEEIVRTLVGSLSLVLAVPLSTFIASWFYTRKEK